MRALLAANPRMTQRDLIREFRKNQLDPPVEGFAAVSASARTLCQAKTGQFDQCWTN